MAASAVAPTAIGRSRAVQKHRGGTVVHIIKTIVPLLVFTDSLCDAFRVAPFRRMTRSSSVKTMDIRRRTFDISILVDDDAMVLKASLVDQEQDDIPPNFGTAGMEGIRTDGSTFPDNPIHRFETWFLDRLEDAYAYSQRQVKCPFFRRRYGDILDDIEGFARFVLIRPYFQDSSPRLGPRMSCKSMSREGKKAKHLPVGDILEILRKDWRSPRSHDVDVAEAATTTATTNEKGYYVTGRMSTRIYRDDCEFTSPDPDLPLKGLRKYIGVASHLFDSKASRSKLLSLQTTTVPIREGTIAQAQSQAHTGQFVIKAQWQLSLTINLPWKPQLSEFSGSTLYFLDEDHLICRHQETWDISVWDAFLDTLPISKEYKSKGNNQSSSGSTPQCPFAALSRQLSPQKQQQRQHSSSTVLPSWASEKSKKQSVDQKVGPSVECTKSHDPTVVEEEVCIGG